MLCVINSGVHRIRGGSPTRRPLRVARANKYFSSPFAIRRGDRVGRPLCAEGPPKRHCQFESKGAQRHLSPSRTHQTKGCTKFTENPHQYRPIYTHDSAGRPRGNPYGFARANEYFSSPFAMRGNDHMLGLPTRKPLRGCSRKQIFFIACLRYVGATAWGARLN